MDRAAAGGARPRLASVAHRRRHGRAAGGAGAAPGLGRRRAARRNGISTRAVLGWIERSLRPAVTACGRGRDRGGAGRARRQARRARSDRRAEPRPARRTADRAQFLSRSIPARCRPRPPGSSAGTRPALLVERYAQEHGNYPARLALSAWGTANMRTGGDDIAQALALIGVRPVWEGASGRVTGFEILPASVLDRPRVDVTLRISGFFRDAFPGLIDLFDSAVRAVAALDEPPATNPLAARVAADRAALEAAGAAPDEADAPRRLSRVRLEAGGLRRRVAGPDRRADLAGRSRSGRRLSRLERLGLRRRRRGQGRARPVRGAARRRPTPCCTTRTTASTICSTATIITSSRAGWRSRSGTCRGAPSRSITTTIRSPTGRASAPCARRLGRIVRGRAANPRWIAGVMRHGYKGAAEIAATVDYLFAFAATARAVDDAHFDALYEAYLGDAGGARLHGGAQPGGARRNREPVPRGGRARPVAARGATASAAEVVPANG